MNIDLNGKRILVTGASRGIGKAVSEQLIKSGATVIAHYNSNPVSLDSLSSTESERLVPVMANLEKANDTLELFAAAIEKGPIDVIINNAGIAIESDPEGDQEDFMASWQKTMNVNLQAVGLLCNKAIEHFKSFGGGIIINISSRAAFRGDTAKYLAYAASKGGVVSLTRSIARAYGKQNIAAFNIAPGFVKTDMANEFIEIYGEEYVKDDIALPDLTQPKDLAPLITLLASGMANHATGGTFDVNAGSYVH